MLKYVGIEEKRVLLSAIGVLTFSACVLAYLYWGRGLDLPGCVTDVAPYQEASVKRLGVNQVEVRYLAKMWAYEPSEIQVKPGTELLIYLHSADVNHGFHIDGTDVNLMAVPGAVNFAKLKVTREGDYSIVCHEFCGAGHQNMAAVIRVRESAGPDAIIPVPLAQRMSPDTGGKSKLSPVVMANAQKLLATKGCIGCHSADGKVLVGPSFQKIYGRAEKLTDGTDITVTEEYLRESILEPGKKIVQGFQPLMPKLPLAEDEVETLISYLKEQK
jgi:cytochrome c oxidase subunit 2